MEIDKPPRHPEEFRDTDPQALEVWLDLQRKMPAGEKLAAVLNASQFVLQMYEMGVRRLYPEADDREVLLRVAARHLPRELMIAAYGWDPQGHGESR
jgi:hypothetical protein